MFIILKIIITKTLFFEIANCGGQITDTTGTITSPEWPLSYPYHNNCTWTITCADNVVISVKNFAIGPTLKLGKISQNRKL